VQRKLVKKEKAMRFFICFLILSCFLTACQSPKIIKSDKTNTLNKKKTKVAVALPVKIEKMKDIEKLKKGDIISLTPALKKWFNLFSANATYTEEEKKALRHWRKRNLIKNLKGVFLKTYPMLRIERNPNKSGLIIRFKVHREFECRVTSFDPEMEDKILSLPELKGEVLIEIKPDWNYRCIDGLFLESLVIKNKNNERIAKLNRPDMKIIPDSRLAFKIYEEGLKIQKQAEKLNEKGLKQEADKLYLKALTNYTTAMNTDKDIAPVWNHCAYFLITNKNPKFYKPKKGLKLALRALASIRKYSNGQLPDVLDTVAWGYFKNGNTPKAIVFQEQAVKLSPRDTGMKNSLKIFKKALEKSKLEKNKTGKKKENNVKQ
jgi:tetratricopeptide (TPR) repeat protein